MNVMKQDHHTRGEEHKAIDQKYRLPYWKRAHSDWRLWTIVLLMLVAMIYYVASDNFGLLYRSTPEPPVPATPLE